MEQKFPTDRYFRQVNDFMINYIKGKVTQKGEDHFVIETSGGIGFKVYASPSTLMNISYDETQVFTYMNVTENDISLYGFLSAEELGLFYRLITVSGVGPKSAAGLLSALSPSQIVFAIVAEDVKTLSSGPGIGRKTAQRIILELRDKLSKDGGYDISEKALSDIAEPIATSDERAEATEALIALGFTRGEAAKAVSAVYIQGMTTEEILKQSLRALS